MSAQLRLWIANSGVQLRLLWRSLKVQSFASRGKLERLVSPLEDKAKRAASPLGEKFEGAASPPEEKLNVQLRLWRKKTERAASPPEEKLSVQLRLWRKKTERAAAPPLARVWKSSFRDIENGIPYFAQI